jgi:hypothetical protein
MLPNLTGRSLTAAIALQNLELRPFFLQFGCTVPGSKPRKSCLRTGKSEIKRKKYLKPTDRLARLTYSDNTA